MNAPAPTSTSTLCPALPPLPRSRVYAPLGPGLPRLLLLLALFIALFDLCFWGLLGKPGLSITLLALGCGGLLLASAAPRLWSIPACFVTALLVGAAWAAAIETGLCNSVVLLLLIPLLAAELRFGEIETAWGRACSIALALIRAPGRPFWLVGALGAAGVREGGVGMGRWFSIAVLLLPALALALIFGALLGAGNAIFAAWTGDFFHQLGEFFLNLISPGRLFFWAFVALLFLPLLRPAPIGDRWWRWTQSLPRWPEVLATRDTRLACLAILIVLNLLFALANGTDLIFLWSGAHVPAGVTASEFVHDGVNALIFTALLSGLILSQIFEQPLAVVRSRALKTAALLWIGQNVFLLLSTALRLSHYIAAYDLTVLRVSCFIFLLLIAAGFTLLALMVTREKSLAWLIAGCAQAGFVTLYIVQFLNVSGWVADYNVAHPRAGDGPKVDLPYLSSLGPAAWPALHAYRATHGSDFDWEEGKRRFQADEIDTFLGRHDWRNYSLRAHWNRWALPPENDLTRPKPKSTFHPPQSDRSWKVSSPAILLG